MLINHESLTGIFKGFKVLFKQALDKKATFWEKLAMKIMSSTKSETYAWFLNIPQMREWIGDREMKNLSADGYTIRNKPYEATIVVPRDDIDDDALGIYRPQIEMLAEQAKVFPDTLIAELMQKGTKNLCYDKKPFFSGEHKVGANNVSNLGSYKLSIESYGAARAAMMSLKNDVGKSLGIMPNLLVVPPALEGVGLKLLKSQQIDSSDNIYYNSAELLVLPALAGSDNGTCSTYPSR